MLTWDWVLAANFAVFSRDARDQKPQQTARFRTGDWSRGNIRHITTYSSAHDTVEPPTSQHQQVPFTHTYYFYVQDLTINHQNPIVVQDTSYIHTRCFVPIPWFDLEKLSKRFPKSFHRDSRRLFTPSE